MRIAVVYETLRWLSFGKWGRAKKKKEKTQKKGEGDGMSFLDF